MHVLTVAPLTKGIPYEELSYFSKDEVNAGDLVEITVRKRICRALVLEISKVEDERQSLRHASFNIKKISKILSKNFLSQKLWKELEYSSSLLLKPIGSIINDLLSEKSFDALSPIVETVDAKGFEMLLLEQDYETRITRYKTTIREFFSKKKSLVIFFPTVNDLLHAKELLSRGIDDYVVTLHGSLTEKQYNDSVIKVQNEKHAVLILATPTLIPWQREDLGYVVIEREHSHYYYTYGDSSYDMRPVLQNLARGANVPCLLGSHMLSLYAHRLYKEKSAYEIMPLQYRNDTGITVIPMEDDNRSASPYFSRQAINLIHAIKTRNKGHLFIYAHRKGMYPTTVCGDCGVIFSCDKCRRPYVLHKIAGVRTYICHGCEHVVHLTEETTLACRYCGGWRMTLLGISTGGVEEELQKLGVPTFVIDSERVTTKSKAKKIYKEWQDAEFGILLGTEMAQNMLAECDGIVILSLDSLFSLPEYRTDEKILSLVTEMSEKIKKHNGIPENKLLLQTRLKQMPVFRQLSLPSFRDVYDTGLKEREQFLLPPYFIVIKASFSNIDDIYKTRLTEELSQHTIEWYEQGKGVSLLFIHIKADVWQKNAELRIRLKVILEGSNISVNPLHFFL